MSPSRRLSVLDRGSFFDDSFFREAWDDFDIALQNILDRFDSRGMKVEVRSRPQCHDLYRRIRSRNIDDDVYESQAVQINEKDGSFQAVMDVRDFNPRQLQVRAIDDRIVVEGRYEKTTGDGATSSAKGFCKEFSLPPQADIDRVTTALSKDGILTIKAPKKEGVPASVTPKTPRASQSVQESFSERKSSDGKTSSFRSSSSRKVIQSSGSFDSTDSGFESLPRDLKERLMVSGRRTSSPAPSHASSSSTPSCTSPTPSEVPSEAMSDTSRVSTTMEFDIGNKAAMQRSEVTFNVGRPSSSSFPQKNTATSTPVTNSSNLSEPNPLPSNLATYQAKPDKFAIDSGRSTPRYSVQSHQDNYGTAPEALDPNLPSTFNCGGLSDRSKSIPMTPLQSGGNTNISITEENGKRVLTTETENVIRESDGYMKTRETATEITAKNKQAARREANTRIFRQEDDPQGEFRRMENADVSETSESCVHHGPDGSLTKLKRSTYSSSVQQSSRTRDDDRSLVGEDSHPSEFRSFSRFLNRGEPASQLPHGSPDSHASGHSTVTNTSSHTGFSADSSHFPFSRLSNRPLFSDVTQSLFSERSPRPTFFDSSRESAFSNRANHSAFSDLSNHSFSDRTRQSAFPERRGYSVFSNEERQLGYSEPKQSSSLDEAMHSNIPDILRHQTLFSDRGRSPLSSMLDHPSMLDRSFFSDIPDRSLFSRMASRSLTDMSRRTLLSDISRLSEMADFPDFPRRSAFSNLAEFSNFSRFRSKSGSQNRE